MRRTLWGFTLACVTCGGQALLPTLPCGQEAALYSINGNTPTTVQFVNTTAQTVMVYWRDYNGNRVFYMTLASGTSYVQPTFYTHPWVITDTANRCIAIYEPAPTAGIAQISANGLVLTQTGFTFQAVQGGPAPAASSFKVLNGATGALALSVSASTLSGGSWLSVSPASGTADSTKSPPIFSVSAKANGLAPGDYYGQIRVDSPGAANTPQFLSIVLNVSGPAATPVPTLQPSGLVFVAAGTGVNPGTQAIHLTTTANHPSPFTVSATTVSGGQWLNVVPASGVLNPGQPLDLQVSINSSAVAQGSYQGSVAVNFPQDNIAESAGVVLIVRSPSASTTAVGGAARGGSLAIATCTPSKLLPTFTMLGSNFVAPAAWPAAIEVLVTDNCGSPMLGGSVVVDFSNGDPSLRLVSELNGFWSATWAPSKAITTSTVVTATASQPETGLTATATLSGSVAANDQVPQLTAAGIVSAASYSAAASPSPGELVSIFGLNMADGASSASTLPLSTQLSGASLLIAGQLFPLVFTSPGQINAVMPYEVPTGAIHQMILQRGTRLSLPQPVPVAPAEPAIFTTDLSGKGQGHIYVVSGTQQILADASHPAQAGDVLTIYCSGLGAVSPPVADGAATPSDSLRPSVNPATLTIGNVAATILFSGLAPGFTGLYQVNAVVPAGIARSGQTPVVLTVASLPSATVTMGTR